MPIMNLLISDFLYERRIYVKFTTHLPVNNFVPETLTNLFLSFHRKIRAIRMEKIIPSSDDMDYESEEEVQDEAEHTKCNAYKV